VVRSRNRAIRVGLEREALPDHQPESDGRGARPAGHRRSPFDSKSLQARRFDCRPTPRQMVCKKVRAPAKCFVKVLSVSGPPEPKQPKIIAQSLCNKYIPLLLPLPQSASLYAVMSLQQLRCSWKTRAVGDSENRPVTRAQSTEESSMNTVNILTVIVRNLGRPIILAALGLAMFAENAKAAGIELYVMVQGRWALIDTTTQTGGRRVWDGRRQTWVTDRAARGETVWANVYNWYPAEFADPIIRSSSLSSTAGSTGLGASGRAMPTPIFFVVPESPHWDNVHVNVRTVSGNFSKYLPVGRR
jgi:hypothetical protein